MLQIIAMLGAGSAAMTSRVQCKGTHVLCSSAICTISPEDASKAVCSCWKRNDSHTVSIAEILNDTIKEATQQQCKNGCAVNEAPICKAIGQQSTFAGRATAAGMVSTFSWAGRCDAVRGHNQTACPASPWAACMTAPCWAEGGSVKCECPLFNSSWADFGPATTKDGRHCQGVVSTVPADFDMSIMPGSEYALEACAALPPAARKGPGSSVGGRRQ